MVCDECHDGRRRGFRSYIEKQQLPLVCDTLVVAQVEYQAKFPDEGRKDRGSK